MKISFEKDDLRDCCCHIETAERVYGPQQADLLVSLIAEAEAFASAAEWHDFLVNDVHISGEKFEVTVGPDYIASFVAVGKKFTAVQDGQPDWSTVERIKLVDIRRRG